MADSDPASVDSASTSAPGANLPGFRAVQLAFAAHIRNPEVHPRPTDVPPERMQVYLDLFYNNIEGFLAGAFPVAKRVLGDVVWHALARRFVHEHPSDSPYFLDISQEYLAFLDQAAPAQAPDFLLELCHYEWVELSLKVDERDLPVAAVNAAGDLLTQPLVLNPLLWLLSYRYPVQRIKPDFVPEAAPQEPTLLVVYRDPEDQVRFREVGPLAFALLQELLRCEEAATAPSGSQLLEAILDDDSLAEQLRVERLEQGAELLEELRACEVLLGTHSSAESI